MARCRSCPSLPSQRAAPHRQQTGSIASFEQPQSSQVLRQRRSEQVRLQMWHSGRLRQLRPVNHRLKASKTLTACQKSQLDTQQAHSELAIVVRTQRLAELIQTVPCSTFSLAIMSERT